MTSAKLYSVEQIRDIEHHAINGFQITAEELMQRAAKAALLILKRNWPHARYITILCGPGNNGGDGYMLAYFAQRMGLHVLVQQVGEHHQPSAATAKARELCEKNHVHIEPYQHDVKKADVIIDAIFGIGFRGVVPAEFASVINAVNESDCDVFSLDVPSGLNADTAAISTVAVKAEATVTFIGLKSGLITGQGRAHSGKVIVDDLSLPPACMHQAQSCGYTLQFKDFSTTIAPRPLNASKYDFGHLVIVGGYRGYAGAVRMAAEAALRVGAGLVSVATHPDHAAMINCHCPEIMAHPIHRPKQLRPLLKRATAIVLGPGLGRGSWSKMMYKETITDHKPMVVDADALNLLSDEPIAQDNWVLTPHVAEAARLLKSDVAHIRQDRIAAVHELYDKYQGACVLKGAGTLLFARDLHLRILQDGNPAMATAGMGDVLSGVIGGLLAQGLKQNYAVELGLCLHARAADIAASEGEHGMLATDLIPIVRRLLNRI